jgi:predicted ATPase
MKIERLHVPGYRSLRNIYLDLKQLNVIVGENGSGKSNLYRALQLLSTAANGRFAKKIANEGGSSKACAWASITVENIWKKTMMRMHDMKNLTRLTLFLSFFLFVSTATWADGPASENVPLAIAIPASQTLKLTLKAHGDQVYECRAVTAAPDKFGWVLKEPDADLFDKQGHKVGHHSAGPKWEISRFEALFF